MSVEDYRLVDDHATEVVYGIYFVLSGVHENLWVHGMQTADDEQGELKNVVGAA